MNDSDWCWAFLFHGVQGPVRRVEKRPDGIGLAWKTGNTHAHGKHGLFAIPLEEFANPKLLQAAVNRAWVPVNEKGP